MKGFDNRDRYHDLYSRVYSDFILSASEYQVFNTQIVGQMTYFCRGKRVALG